MRKYITILSIVVISFSIVLWAQNLWQGETMSASDVKKKWGSEPLDLKKFKEGSIELRSKMAYSIMNDSQLIGKTQSYIEENFGQHDGFYFIDTYPAYIIQEGKNKKEETWQIVFKLGRGSKVHDIIIHKNCCN